jgi:hypothetical protein
MWRLRTRLDAETARTHGSARVGHDSAPVIIASSFGNRRTVRTHSPSARQQHTHALRRSSQPPLRLCLVTSDGGPRDTWTPTTFSTAVGDVTRLLALNLCTVVTVGTNPRCVILGPEFAVGGTNNPLWREADAIDLEIKLNTLTQQYASLSCAACPSLYDC